MIVALIRPEFFVLDLESIKKMLGSLVTSYAVLVTMCNPDPSDSILSCVIRDDDMTSGELGSSIQQSSEPFESTCIVTERICLKGFIDYWISGEKIDVKFVDHLLMWENLSRQFSEEDCEWIGLGLGVEVNEGGFEKISANVFFDIRRPLGSVTEDLTPAHGVPHEEERDGTWNYAPHEGSNVV